MTVYQFERFSDIEAEILPKIQKHWAEVILVDYPNWELKLSDKYKQLDQANLFGIFTARRDGEIIAYAAFVLSESFKTENQILASSEGFWVDKSARGLANVAIRLLKFSEQKLKEIGVTAIIQSHPESVTNFGRLLTHNGYVPHERLYLKMLR
jgi:hypothetical protein